MKIEELQINENNSKLQQLKDSLNEVMNNEGEMNQLNRQLIEQERFIHNKYQGLEKNIDTLNDLKRKTQEYSDTLISEQQEIETIQKSLEALTKEKSQMFEEKMRNQNLLNDTETIISLINEYHSYNEEVRTIKENQDKLLSELKSCESQIERFNFGDETLDIDAVDRIRANLKRGQNCPVCNHVVTEVTVGVHHEYHNIVQRKIKLSRELEANSAKVEWIESLTQTLIDKLLKYKLFKDAYKNDDILSAKALFDHEHNSLMQNSVSINETLEHINQQYEQLNHKVEENNTSITALKNLLIPIIKRLLSLMVKKSYIILLSPLQDLRNLMISRHSLMRKRRALKITRKMSII